MSIATHQLYKAGDSRYDVAVIKLEHDVPFTVNGIRPACLTSSAASRMLTGKCVVTGYGVDDGKLLLNIGTRRYTVLQTVGDPVCEFFYGAERGRPSNFLYR